MYSILPPLIGRQRPKLTEVSHRLSKKDVGDREFVRGRGPIRFQNWEFFLQNGDQLVDQIGDVHTLETLETAAATLAMKVSICLV